MAAEFTGVRAYVVMNAGDIVNETEFVRVQKFLKVQGIPVAMAGGYIHFEPDTVDADKQIYGHCPFRDFENKVPFFPV
jgi:hypothetical protein